VAITSLTPVQNALRSTVALKVLMAVSGLIMIGYLLAHMYGNLKVFAGAEAFNTYAHHLRTIGEPILPRTGLLWIIRAVLIVAVLSHVGAALVLWARARTARGGPKRYLFVIYHLLHLTWNVIHPGGAADTPYARVVNGFQIWWVVAAYTVALIAVGFHLRHGTWSALTTLGANTSALARRRLNLLAYAVAGVVTIGFLLPPYFILFGLVR